MQYLWKFDNIYLKKIASFAAVRINDTHINCSSIHSNSFFRFTDSLIKNGVGYWIFFIISAVVEGFHGFKKRAIIFFGLVEAINEI